MFSSLLPAPKYSVGKKIPQINVPSKSSSKALLSWTSQNSNELIVQNTNTTRTIANLHMNKDGSLNYSQTISAAANPGRQTQTSYEDTIPLKVRYPNLKHHFPKPSSDDEELQECIEETRDAINKILSSKLGVESKDKSEVSYYKYKTNEIINPNNNEEEGRGRERVLQIRDLQEDPMLPPKFKLRKNRHKEPSPPPPILKKTATKPLSKEEQQKWNIPAAISNWKNNQGFTISLDKRMLAANGGSSEDTSDALNIEKFGSLSSALEDADKQAREEITIRNQLMKELAIKEQQEKEQKLKELAEISRMERSKRRHSDSRNPVKKQRY
ncbi:pre-mRNA-processing protein 45 [[Candida] anglica]|uniref:Pre-mRNA-processing protein 45 n=1 Tax=[Candida] anglica TaxID=148631 RepID=A0ABP0ECD1_9ASCO